MQQSNWTFQWRNRCQTTSGKYIVFANRIVWIIKNCCCHFEHFHFCHTIYGYLCLVLHSFCRYFCAFFFFAQLISKPNLDVQITLRKPTQNVNDLVERNKTTWISFSTIRRALLICMKIPHVRFGVENCLHWHLESSSKWFLTIIRFLHLINMEIGVSTMIPLSLALTASCDWISAICPHVDKRQTLLMKLLATTMLPNDRNTARETQKKTYYVHLFNNSTKWDQAICAAAHKYYTYSRVVQRLGRARAYIV